MYKKHINCPLPFRGGMVRGSSDSQGFGFHDHTHHFRQWIGRTLTKYERTLINRLERHRRKQAVKVHIIDKQGENSTQLIIDYMRYIQEMHPRQPCVIYAPSRKEANAISKNFPGTTLTASVRRPNTARGMNYDMALVLNPPQKYLPAIMRTIMPAVWDRPGCIVIILTVPHSSLHAKAKESLPSLPPFYYQQLADPPNPPPRDPDKVIIIDLTDYTPIQQPIQSPFPSGEGREEAPLSI